VGISQDLQRWQSILLSAVVVALTATALASYALIAQLRTADQSVSYEHAERVIDADGMEIAMFARSANARGYLLSGDALFLENRRAARSELSARLKNLRIRNVDTAMLVEVERLLARLDIASDRAIATYAASTEQARHIWESEARPVQDLVAKQIGELVSVERAAFTGARDRAADAWRRSAVLLVALLAGVAVLLVLLFYGYGRASRALFARQRAEQEQATFRLLDQVPVGIFVLSARGTPYYANQHAKKLLGRGIVPSPADKLAETYEAYEAGTDRTYPTNRLPILRALAGEVSECSDIEIRRGDESVPLHVVGAPVHDSHGDLLYAVAGFQDVRELQRVAMRDALTGLANRAAIMQIFARERAVSARARRPFSLALIDLDRFKSVNDTHGHASGDEVLKRTAAAITASLRRSDAVGRWGGEELVVLLPNTDAAGAGLAVEKALAAVRALSFLGKDGARFTVTFSAGVVVTTASEAIDEAVARADALLYEAKAAGRDRVNTGQASA
jgi:diguanylate cyclase (GGDEF)-like protein